MGALVDSVGRGGKLWTFSCWHSWVVSCISSDIFYIDQFSNLDGIAGRILGCYEHGPTFFVREILDGIVAKPGGDYIHGGYRHRQALQQSRVKYHGLPGPPLVRADHES